MAPSDRTDVVTFVKADLERRGVPLAGPCGAFEITKRVAWLLRDDGAGLLQKSEGNRCEGCAVDIVAFRDGSYVDILIDGGGANGPAWQVKSDRIDPARWRAPVPQDTGTDVPAPLPPLPPVPMPPADVSDALARVIDEASARIVEGLTLIALQVATLNDRVTELQREGLRWKLK